VIALARWRPIRTRPARCKTLVEQNNSPSAPNALAVNLVVAGDIQQDLGQTGPAGSSYASALALVPTQPGAFFGRGRLEFYAGQNAAALADFRSMVANGTSSSPYPYYLMWLSLAEQQAGSPGTELSSAKVADASKWPWPLVAVYRGQASEKAALAAAAASDSGARAEFTCEANFYLGAKELLGRGAAAGTPMLADAAKSCPLNLIERNAAALLLARAG